MFWKSLCGRACGTTAKHQSIFGSVERAKKCKRYSVEFQVIKLYDDAFVNWEFPHY